MVYKWSPGYRGKGDAQVAGEVCAALEEQGRLTAEALVEESRPEEAPLHDYFEWRDDVAAERWRRHQGNNIINHLVIVRPDNQEPQKLFYNIKEAGQNYESIHAIVRQEDKYESLKNQALQELLSFQRRYKEITELSEVLKAIDLYVEQNVA